MDVLYDLVEAFVAFQDSGPPLLLTLVLIVVTGVPVTLLHELGHAWAAKRMLDTDVEVKIGTAGKLAEWRLGQIHVELAAPTPWVGRAGHATFDDARARARDIVLIALAGPAASLAGAVATGMLLSAASAGSAAHAVLWVATSVGTMAVILNLIPLEFRERSGERWRSDGRLALDAYRTIRALT